LTTASSRHPKAPPSWSYWVALPAIFLLWWILAASLKTTLLPDPFQVAHTAWVEFQRGALTEHLLITLRRVAIAFICAMTAGILVGVWMGRSRFINALLDPLLVLFLNLPALVVIILLYVWFGLIEAAAILAVVINKVPNVAVTVREGARNLDVRLEQMARVYHFSRWQCARHVIWPQLFPYVMAATRGGLALIWKIVLVVELLGRSDGIGFQLHMAFQVFDVSTNLAYSLAFVLVVQLVELAVLQPLERYSYRWRQQEIHHANPES